jgi:hypothetical protein
VADRGDEFASRIHVMHELIGFGMAPDVIWRVAARHHNAVEIGGVDVIVRKLAFDRVAQLASVRLASLCADREVVPEICVYGKLQ